MPLSPAAHRPAARLTPALVLLVAGHLAAADTVTQTDNHFVNNVKYIDTNIHHTTTVITGGTVTLTNSITQTVTDGAGSSWLKALDLAVLRDRLATPAASQRYEWATGVLALNDAGNLKQGVTTLSVAAGTTIQATYSGTGLGYAAGIRGAQNLGVTGATVDALTIDNAGTIQGHVLTNDGTAAAIAVDTTYGGSVITNSGSLTASATYDAIGLSAEIYYGRNDIVNSGTITAKATGGQHDIVTGFASASGVKSFCYADNLTFTNTATGVISGDVDGGNASDQYQLVLGANIWAQGNGTVGGRMDFVNHGTITAISRNATVGRAQAAYCGSNGGPVSVFNDGTITATAPSALGWALGTENDEDDPLSVTNLGSIYHNSAFGLVLFTGKGPATVVNKGSIYGGLYGFSCHTWQGPVTMDDWGDIACNHRTHTAIWMGLGDDTLTLHGLPTITGIMDGNTGTNHLVFKLDGTLEKVNDQPATKGNDLSAYNLGTSGTIVVSGKTYQWTNFIVSSGNTTPPDTTPPDTGNDSGGSGCGLGSSLTGLLACLGLLCRARSSLTSARQRRR
jgi:hypothetical protein